MEHEGAQQLIEQARNRDGERGNSAFYVKRILERIAILEADVERAREMVITLSEDAVKDVKWLDSIARTEGQIQKMYQELAQFTREDESAGSGKNGFQIVSDIPRPSREPD